LADKDEKEIHIDERLKKFEYLETVTHELFHVYFPELSEKKVKRDRCLRIADRKFNKPSAYKSGAVVRCRAGKIWKGIK